jgi:hypothetical protein
LKDKISEFLSGNATNQLLKSVGHDISQPQFLAQCKALGLVSLFISTPLWNLIESRVHILDIGFMYHHTIDYLNDASLNTDDFMSGKFQLPYAEKSTTVIANALIQPWDHDGQVQAILQNMLPAMASLLKQIFVDHLPGGKWENAGSEVRSKTIGKPKT